MKGKLLFTSIRVCTFPALLQQNSIKISRKIKISLWILYYLVHVMWTCIATKSHYISEGVKKQNTTHTKKIYFLILKLWQNKKGRNLFEMPTKNDVFFSAGSWEKDIGGHLKTTLAPLLFRYGFIRPGGFDQTNCSRNTISMVAQAICTLTSNLSGWPDTFLGSATLKNVRLHHPYFFQVQEPYFFSTCHLRLKLQRAEARLPLLFLNNKNKSCNLSHNPTFSTPDTIFCTLYFGNYFFFRIENQSIFLKQE